MTFQEAVCIAEAQFGTIGTTGSYTPPQVGRAVTRAAASARRRPIRTPPRSSRWTSIPRPAGSTVPRVWIAHDIGRALNPTLVRGQVEGSVYMGLGEALMEEQAFRRLPPRLSHALVHKFPSMLEYKSPTSLDMPEIFTDLIEHPDPAGPFGAKEVGQGPLLPIMPARRQRGLRRGRRAHRRESRSRRRRSCRRCRRKPPGKPRAHRTGGVPGHRLARGAAGGAAVGRRRRPRVERARARSRGARPKPASKRRRGCGHDAPARVPLSRAAHGRRSGGVAGRSSRRHDAAGRRHRPAAEHEAAPADARDRSSACVGSANLVEISNGDGLTI